MNSFAITLFLQHKTLEIRIRQIFDHVFPFSVSLLSEVREFMY